MSDRSVRTSSSSARRMMGLLVAAGVTLIFGGVFLFMSGQQPSDARGAPLPKDIVDIGEAPATANSNTDPNLIQVGDHARLQSADKNDPNRVAWELNFDRLEPVGPGYYTLAQPRAWYYFKDGRTLHVRADSGRVKMPATTKPPESGEFRGHVVLRMFPAGAAKPSGAIDPDRDEPSLVGITDSLAFDMVLLELTTQDHITVAAKNLLFEGDGLRVVANQVKEQIVLIKTKGQYVRFNPDVKETRSAARPATVDGAGVGASSVPVANTPTSLADSSATTPLPPAASIAATAAPSASTPAPAKPASIAKEHLYKAVIGNEVTVTQTTRRLTADSLEIFARLIDNQLPEHAFGIWESTPDRTKAEGVAAGPAKGPATGAPASGASAAGAPASPANEATALFVRGNEDIVMSWNGSLTVTPVLESGVPPELEGGNHFAAKFLAERGPGHVVAMEDTAAGARGECAQVSYAATTRMLSMSSGSGAPDVKFMANDIGRILVKGAQVDIGTGIAKADGPGQLLALRNNKSQSLDAAGAPVDKNTPIPADQIRQITWTDQADFKFRTERGRIQSALEFAKFDGRAVARDRTSSISADSLRAEFAGTPSPGKQQASIRHIHAEGSVVAIHGPKFFDPSRAGPVIDPFVTANKLDVSFAPSKDHPDEVEPVRAVAVGNVKGATRDASIKGQTLEVSLTRDANHALVPSDFVGRGEVEVERADGVSAKADSIRANPLLRTASLSGNVALAKGPSVVRCAQAEMDDASGILRILSAGSFDHDQAQQISTDGSSGNAGAPDPTHITATWTNSMMFNNIAGTLDASGKTKVISTSALQTETLLAERLQLAFTPGAPPAAAEVTAQPTGQGAPATVAIGNNRQLLRAKAIGASESREGAPHATIEVRRYAANPATATGANGGAILSGTRPNAPAVLPPDTGDPSRIPERLLEQVFYVEGPTIDADGQAGTITVPSAGRAVILDQRAATNQALISNSSGVPVAGVGRAGGAKGTSSFTWAESMQFVRSTGMLTMKKDVELIHLPQGSTQATRMVAMKMEARFNSGAKGQPLAPGSSQRSAELVEAIATGAVYAESGPQKLLCDRISYDALRGAAEASAVSGNRVTLHDDRKSTPLVAKRLFWDLVKDRIEVMEPAPMTAPR